jgi:hypothetical protein
MKINELRSFIQDTVNEVRDKSDFAMQARIKRDIRQAQNLIIHYIKNKDKNALIEAHKTLEIIIQMLDR